MHRGLERFVALPVRVVSLLQPGEPRGGEGPPPQVLDVEVDHTRARHRGGRGLAQVLHFEQDGHLRRHHDALAGEEREQFVIVQQRVHGLDPQCVYGPVEQRPLLVGALVLADVAHEPREDPVRPLVRRRVEAPVNLVVGQRQRVDGVHLHFLEFALARAVLAQLRHRRLEHLPGGGFPRAGFADDHVPVPRHLAVEDLDDLDDPVVHHLQPELDALALEHRAQLAARVGGLVDSREQVAEQRAEQGDVEVDELGHDQVLHRAVEDGFLGALRVDALVCAGGARDGDHERTQRVVVVVLLRELLLRELHDRDHLLGEALGGGEALGEHHDLGDEREIGHHHRHRPHDGLQVVR